MLHSTCCYLVATLLLSFDVALITQESEMSGGWDLGIGFLPHSIEHGGRAQSPSKGDSKEWLHLIPGNKRHIFLGPISSVNQIHLCHRIIVVPELGHLLLKWRLLFFIMPQYLPVSIGPMCLWQSYLFSAASNKSSHYSKPSPDTQMSPAHRLQASSSLSALNIFLLFASYCFGAVVKLKKKISPTSFTFESLPWKYCLN